MNWYETLMTAPVRALNEVRSNVWSVALVITGIVLLLHGHDSAGNSLITGAFAVFRSSSEPTHPPDIQKVETNADLKNVVKDPNAA